MSNRGHNEPEIIPWSFLSVMVLLAILNAPILVATGIVMKIKGRKKAI